MTPRIPAVVMAVLILSIAAHRAAAQTYTVDPDHTSVIFSTGHMGLSYTFGMFREASGKYMIDKANPANCQFQFVIKANSLFTNNVKRDDHLRGPDFFNVQQYPDITFVSSSCAKMATQDGSVVYQVTGNLTMHGITRPITINRLQMIGEGPGAYGDPRTGFLCQVELKRSDFRMDNLLEKNGAPMVGDAIGITVSFEGTTQAPSAAPARPQ